MTVKEAQRELERIAADLEIAIEQLVARPAEVDQWPILLRASLEAIEKARKEFPHSAERETFRPLIQRIQDRAKEVQLLLESAALFYCGCLAVGATQATGYGQDGSVQHFAASGRMQLEA